MGLKDNLRELENLRRTLLVTEEQMEFGRQVRLARKKRGLTLEALAQSAGLGKSYLSQIETGYAPPPRDDKVRRIARALGLDEEALLARAHFAQLPDDLKARMARLARIFDTTEQVIRALLAAKEAPPPEAGAAEGGAANVDLEALEASGLLHHLTRWGAGEGAPGKVRRIPVINKVAAGYPEEFTDLGYPAGVADEYVSGPAELDDPNAFAVRVVGDSMEPRYHEGDIVILSPAAEVKTGDDCFVRYVRGQRPNDSEATFKRVFFDSPSQVRLQPLNERHAPTVLEPSEIRGIFRAVARYERL
jgi:phage repressor protein C with HTH and peptisase S24 domain/DNA-binding XRE family transcriptional regulator